MNKIVGITGMNGSGKGTVVDMLVKRGFEHYSASELIMEEVVRLKMPENRDSMIAAANKLREKYGPGYVIEELIRRSHLSSKDAVVESIRTIGEVESLKKTGGILLAVEADQKLRFERIVKRGGVKDNVSWERFIDQEKLESESADRNKQNLMGCRKMADYIIDNNGRIKELENQVELFLNKYER